MKAQDLLILNVGGFGRRLDALYVRLAADEGLREYFISNPGAVLASTVFRNFRPAPEDKVNQFNRALYSILSNPEFMAWGNEFQATVIEDAMNKFPDISDESQALRAYLIQLDRAWVHNELLTALPRFLDKEFLSAGFFRGPGGRPIPDGPDGGVGGDPCPSIPGGNGLPDFGGPCTDPGPPIGPNPVADTVVAAETAVLVVAVAVFVFAITAIDFTPRVAAQGMSRDDVRAALASIQKRMVLKGRDMRIDGKLSDFQGTEGPWPG